MDLVGGYYDAGDNVKFHFPMAFTTTMLAWSVIEFGQSMGPDQINHALDAVSWGSTYLYKSTANVPYKIAAQVGDPYKDHNCWERPEDMDTSRVTYVINQTHPGSELAGEMAAALAASSMAFKSSNPKYSYVLIKRAAQVFDFADKYRGSYNTSVGQGACPFYCDYNGYEDELIWGAAWLYKATGSQYYWNYVQNALPNVFLSSGQFGWDAKDAGINVLLSNLARPSQKVLTEADKFVCSLLPESPTKSVVFSKGGLYFQPGSQGYFNLQRITSHSFLIVVYSRYMQDAHRSVNCGGKVVGPSRLVEFARSQVDYILGSNPLGMSYMVGYGNKFPRRIHHRGSSLPSIVNHPQHIVCKAGTPYFQSKNPNPNILTGAIVGGPDMNDQYADDRTNAGQSEPSTYYVAPFVGVLAFFKGLKG
ncbi:putative endo-1 4-beta-glucanase [Tripterygium wilfordii]|uniref:Endoglucanase n=2 Tax=Tripterygium wilfordii TaxID=458696 RepID=A0A7J7DBD1_TRIWF|nr:putative endo-1 4-beta-glucanase [Tripterygium wilfordii]